MASSWQAHAEEEENINIKENEERNEDGEQGMEMEEGTNKEDINLTKKDCSKEQKDENTEMDYKKGHEKAEDMGIKTLTKVREAENGESTFGMENKGKLRLNKSIPKGGIDIEKVLLKQKRRREELKEKMERKKDKKREARLGFLE